MDLAFGFFMLLWGLLGGGRSSGGGGGGSRGGVDRPEGPEASNRGGSRGGTLTTTPPWPAVAPTGLPAFPGAGWEPDEPPPKAVQERARALVQPLWDKGLGAHRIEQTAGRWIAYRAGITAGNRHGVIAWRVKRPAALPRAPGAPRAPAPRAPAPSSPAPAPAAVRVTVDPAVDIEPLPSPLVPLPVLRRGMGIAPAPPVRDVRLLQNYLHIPVDGRFGAGTEKAVRDFQRAHGLQVDGIVGKATWAALFAPPPRAGATGTWA